MKFRYLIYSVCVIMISLTMIIACDSDTGDDEPMETDFSDLLTNQVDQVIIPAMITYQQEMGDLEAAITSFESSINENNLSGLRDAYQNAYIAYQSAAVHNYFATVNQSLVATTNLFPIDVTLLADLIDSESYNFNNLSQQRANGFPAIDFMLYGPDDIIAYYNEDVKRLAFLRELVESMKSRADVLADQWSGNLRTNFIENGGTALGSSISVQLNETLVYYEDNIRENKVGIPIGLLGPNDTPIEADPTKIEGYYQSLADGNEMFTLTLLRTSIEQMEEIYLGQTSEGTDGQGYDDLLMARSQSAIDTDIKAQFQSIYGLISSRSSISGDQSLYQSVQGLVTLYKSDLLPILNIQDSDGLNDGD